ncbi:uncharacterized protein cdhr5a [Nematolebias whitei]|uniref:uncharacterized protein cdhr5a n=1 Tax=Nematolebias whitei TaxID=451745 RepID=UPI001896B297|nr:uncharacterized protein cdhr5a [Nematolebias whitei]
MTDLNLQEGPLVLEPGPVFAKDGDKNRSEHISYKILQGNEGNLFQIDEDTGNITMIKAADTVGPIILTILASQVTNRDQFAVTQVTFDVMKKSRNPPRFEKERYEGFIYSNSVPESMILRDRSTNRPFRVRARDEDFATGVNPDVKYEVQYSSYVNVTFDGFVVLKRVVKTELFALQLRAVDTTTGEFGTAALSVQVLPVIAMPSSSSIGYRPGDMALLGLIMAALLVLCLIIIGFLLSHLWKGNASMKNICECLGPCLQSEQPRTSRRDSLQFTNDGFQIESDPSRGNTRCLNIIPRHSTFPWPRNQFPSLERQNRHCSTCGAYTNHISKGSPLVRWGRGDEDEYSRKQRRKQGQKMVWFKECKDSSDIEVEIIPDTVGKMEEETEEELEVEMEVVIRDQAGPLSKLEGRQESQPIVLNNELNPGNTSSDKKKGEAEEEH